MPDSVTPKENARALTRYRQSLDAAYRYADENEDQAIERYNESLDSARKYANRSNADSTWRAYKSDWRVFETWCSSVGAAALPASAETLCGFLATEADKGRALSTLRRRVAAIRIMHIARDLPSPHQAFKVALVLKGIANDQKNRKTRQAKPTLDNDLKRMVDALDLSRAKGIRDKALLLVGFDGAFRRSELVMLTVEMLETRPEGILVELPFSKTDQTGDGQIIPILERPGSAYCPVAALRSWLTHSECTEGVIFKRLHKGNSIGKTGLSAQSVALIVKEAVAAAKFDIKDYEQLFSGHSLRRGVMTESARAGASVSDIMHLGRHRKADTAMQYVDKETALDNHPAKSLLR